MSDEEHRVNGTGMVKLFVPGRLCLFGEHSDWAASFRQLDPEIAPGACIVRGTDQGIHATARSASNFEFISRTPDGEQPSLSLPMARHELAKAATRAEFFSYAAGVAQVMLEKYRCGGVRVEVDSADLPVRRGLSSSAAVCVLLARAFNRVYRLGLSIREEMEIAYLGEIATGSRCGRMDQACAFGGTTVRIDFDGEGLAIEEIPSGGSIEILVVDLQSRKDTRRILADLHACFGGEESSRRSSLRRALGEENRRLVSAACQAIGEGDSRRLGQLMRDAQETFDDGVAPACPSELAAPKLHRILDSPEARELSWGGKGVGSQGDGSAQLVCRGREERDELARLLTRRYAVSCLNLTIHPAENSYDSRSE